ncbi:MAG: UDP-N-acetylmuramate dehydrogenase [Candidatus Gracilibacteria bacterium]
MSQSKSQPLYEAFKAECADLIREGVLREQVTLAPLTSFNIGGPADFFAEVKTVEQLEKVITEAVKNEIPYYILGGGSNTLFSDKGFRGVVIRPGFKAIAVTEEPEGGSIVVEAGLPLSQLIQTAAKHELSGMEVWIGLPGTVGGAVRGNAGAGGSEISDFLASATIFDLQTLSIKEFKNEDLKMSYRYSMLKDNPHLIVLSATFHFDKKKSAEDQRITMQETLAKRHASQPKGQNAGCMFKNATRPSPLDPHAVTVVSSGKLIDECGLKGTRIGGIEISMVHGNFLQNVGGTTAKPGDPPAPQATQKDVLDMIALVKKTVKEKENIDLHEEVQIVYEFGMQPESRSELQ